MEGKGNADDSRKQTPITVNVKFAGTNIPAEISVDSKVRDLKSLLQPLTNVLTRGQKLIFKGKVLEDEMTLRSSEVINGSKIMLMASQGLHQGDGPIKKDSPALSNVRRTRDVSSSRRERSEVSIEKSQLDRWKATGVVALAERGLQAIPDEVWACGLSARMLDISHNSLQDVPAGISQLSSLQKLFLNGNNLLDKSISWEGLASLKSLTVLHLDQNNLTELPPALGMMTCLKQLHIANNKLICLPTEIGLLSELQILKANNNRLNSVPTNIGGCTSLVEVDLSSNLLRELPETFDKLKDLKALHLNHNGLKSLPRNVFKLCTQLSILDLHGTEITMDFLRKIEGWDDFDERRRLKHQKQLDFRVTSSAEFDEGADKS